MLKGLLTTVASLFGRQTEEAMKPGVDPEGAEVDDWEDDEANLKIPNGGIPHIAYNDGQLCLRLLHATSMPTAKIIDQDGLQSPPAIEIVNRVLLDHSAVPDQLDEIRAALPGHLLDSQARIGHLDSVTYAYGLPTSLQPGVIPNNPIIDCLERYAKSGELSRVTREQIVEIADRFGMTKPDIDPSADEEGAIVLFEVPFNIATDGWIESPYLEASECEELARYISQWPSLKLLWALSRARLEGGAFDDIDVRGASVFLKKLWRDTQPSFERPHEIRVSGRIPPRHILAVFSITDLRNRFAPRFMRNSGFDIPNYHLMPPKPREDVEDPDWPDED